jgi:hypothetical protein
MPAAPSRLAAAHASGADLGDLASAFCVNLRFVISARSGGRISATCRAAGVLLGYLPT